MSDVSQLVSPVCSCGVTDCPELSWPHEWDPIAASDTCILCGYAHTVGLRIDPVKGVVYLSERAPVITAPYVRWGSGYAHLACAEAETDA